ncbi:hypothetical protein [Streptomyces sp. NPDC004546]|uniref:hypothetical protein n=1 Tax=Streptomyces sp. NPDC004546 TaxID=3154282 RepID=UPI0033BCC2B8
MRRHIGSTDWRGYRALALEPRLHRRLRGANLIASVLESGTGPVVVPPCVVLAVFDVEDRLTTVTAAAALIAASLPGVGPGV